MQVRPIIRIAPGRTGVSIWSGVLFGADASSRLREFLSRVFSVEDVEAVEINRAKAFGRVRYQRSSDAPAVWRKLGEALRAPASARGMALADALFLAGAADQTIRVGRAGDLLSTWRLRALNGRRIRVAHPLMKRRDVAYRLEEELAAIFGVEAFRVSRVSASVAIRFDPALISAARLLRELEKSWPRLLDGLEGPAPNGRFIAAGALLGVAFVGQYVAPAVRPVALLGATLYGLPNVINGARQLAHLRIGLPALYSAGLGFMLLSGLPFTAGVMAVLMQFWPRLAFRTMTRSQRRLFATHRRLPTWARAVAADGAEIETDIDALKPGDLVVARAGEIIPVDGVVSNGLATADERALSGAAGAVDKRPGDRVYAGAFLCAGRLTVRVEAQGGATVAGYIGALLPHSRIERLPYSAQAERIANRNAAPALAVAGLALAGTGLALPAQAVIRPDYATAPRLSAQLGALQSLAEGLHRGVLFRTPAALDLLPDVGVYAFDDSAGLERRAIEVAETIAAEGVSVDSVLNHVAAAAGGSEDDRAFAVLTESLARRLPAAGACDLAPRSAAARYRDEEGRLVEIMAPADVAAAGVAIAAALAEAVAASPYASDPRTKAGGDPRIGADDPLLRPLWVVRDGKAIGVVAFRRQGGLAGVEALAALKARDRKAGFVFLSGKPRAEAEALAARVGVSAVFAGLDQAGKARALRRFGPKTLWVGDGADAKNRPSLEAAALSLSVAGFASAPVDAADVVLLRQGLHGLPSLQALALAHRARFRADYRIVYAANLVGAAGGLVAGFNGMRSGLASNIGTALVYARRRWRLARLIAEVEKRRAQIAPRPVADDAPAGSGARS